MATGQYPRRTSGASSINRQASQIIMVRPYLLSWYIAGKRTAKWNSGWQASQRKTAWSMEGQLQRTDRPVDIVIAAHRIWHTSMGSFNGGGICRSSPTTAGRHMFVSLVGNHGINRRGPVCSCNRSHGTASCERSISIRYDISMSKQLDYHRLF